MRPRWYFERPFCPMPLSQMTCCPMGQRGAKPFVFGLRVQNGTYCPMASFCPMPLSHAMGQSNSMNLCEITPLSHCPMQKSICMYGRACIAGRVCEKPWDSMGHGTNDKTVSLRGQS